MSKKVVFEGLVFEMNATEVNAACQEWARRSIKSGPNGAKFTGPCFVKRDKYGGCSVTVFEGKEDMTDVV